ncbi:TetR family transcriptional regulator [Rhodococcus sp. BP-149]|nr:TetR family transcriptional regulator [Rhodococcus sp. BP-332]MBY6687640.1 TetR family transcriptional regulator [Rhodococcus sp. BP-288]MBY6695795.1 TetR family transcriptional regulator [Rhodococcus sp. BP-188]MBY6700397.1 TetR family transcriptional regulator [Rhodococcus sp. BP-285]MBY6704580.1 TetR family transcriptional regulator [Rhodococcus sp. BP-283]MBY6713522.1 TetR family transcriptional regulator [Rhodococcus sp. BP-160]MBY6714199.1 TetR family transcriptional regulator [Rhodo
MGFVSSGLRDRKKAETRAALSAAAIRLGRQQGFDTVTAEAIARDAGVSTRTFHNYFSSKEEAALYYLEQAAFEWVDLIEHRPQDEDFWDTVRAIVFEIVDDPERELTETVAVARFVEESPALLAKKLEFDRSLSAAFKKAVARRTGLDPDRDLYPSLVQAAVGATVSAALGFFAEASEKGSTTAESAGEVVRLAMQQLERGFRAPLTGSTPLPPD